MSKNITKVQARRWQLTKNDELESKEKCELFHKVLQEKFKEHEEKTRFLIWCYEKAPETGHIHCHMYFEMMTPVSGAGMQHMFCENAHLELCKGTQEQNIKYVQKEGNWYLKGTPSKPNLFANIVDAAANGKDIRYLTEAFPEQVIRNRTNIVATLDMYGRAKTIEKVTDKIQKIKPVPWQDRILKETESEPDDRKVIWIADPAGGGGKSTMIKMLICKYGLEHVLWITGGSMKDIAHAWKGEEIVCFNYCRSLEESVNYNAIESVKDGMVFSPKYDSCKKLFPSPHVIVTANFEPDQRKLTQDRWDIRHLSETDRPKSVATEVVRTAPQMGIPPIVVVGAVKSPNEEVIKENL